jgi:effector-binding domain-containing protein
MEYEIQRSTATAQLIAAVRARVPLGGIAQAYRSSLDKVWAFLRHHPGLRTDGHNLFLYHHDASESGLISVDFGVQVVRHFEPDGDVRCIETPSGEVVRTVHRGPYSGLPGAHASIHEWFRQHRRPPGLLSWEIYGDWTDDPRRLETTVLYLL